MSTTTTGADVAAEEGRITDEDIERARAQIGVPVRQRDVPWNTVAQADSMSHFAFGSGDDNPLFHDPDYGRTTRWHGQIASPLFPISTGLDQTPAFTDPDRKALFRGLFRGTGKYYAGVRWTWYRPVLAGQVLYCETYTTDVSVKTSEFSGGRSVKETYRYLYVDSAGSPVATRDESYVNAERQGSKKAGKLDAIERKTWTDDEFAAVEAAYAAEERRGADPRWREDVSVGDELPSIIRGPLGVVDIISMHMGWGWGGYGIGPLKYAHQSRQRMPAFYQKDAYGVPEVVQRLHWDSARAQELGIPAAYDYGQMRAAWVSQLLTNWAGDDGWVAEMDLQMRGFNFHGDTQTCTAEIREVHAGDGPGSVGLDVRATSQRGEVTTRGTATILLPSRSGGAVSLPVPDDDLRDRAAQVVSRRGGQVGPAMREMHGE